MNIELICLILWLSYNIQTQKNMRQEQKLNKKTKKQKWNFVLSRLFIYGTIENDISLFLLELEMDNGFNKK